MATVYYPDAVFQGGRWLRGVPLAVSKEGTVLELSSTGPDDEVVRLPGRAVLPGFVNAHSHAFQRLLRGRTEYLAAGHEQDDFWSWREAMYAAAGTLSPEQLYVVSRQSFIEMALAGVTTVGEFHYLHHQPDGTPYANVHELALQVVRAARDVGLRMVLLRVGYARAGFQVESNPRQRRFIDADVEVALGHTADLQQRVKSDSLVTVGLAPHSVRAVPRDWLDTIRAAWRGGPLHMHVAEQRAEVAACEAEHGRRPVELLEDVGLLGPHFTAVHAIHLQANEVNCLGATQSNVCACPSTERNLGDGVVDAEALMRAGVHVAVGSDSQAHIDFFQEAQQLEGHLRLVRERRNVLSPKGVSPDGLAVTLLKSLTAEGHRSLGLNGGTLSPGEPADFITLDMEHPSLVGWGEFPLAQLVLGGASSCVADVFVAGQRIVAAGTHRLQRASQQAYSSVVHTLLG